MKKEVFLAKKAPVLLGSFFIVCGLLLAAQAQAVDIKQTKDKSLDYFTTYKVTMNKVTKSRDVVKRIRGLEGNDLRNLLGYTDLFVEKLKWGDIENYELKDYDANVTTATYRGSDGYKYKSKIVVVAAPKSKTVYVMLCFMDERYYKRYHPQCEAYLQSFDKSVFKFKPTSEKAKTSKTADVASLDLIEDAVSDLTLRAFTVDYSKNPAKTSAMNIAKEVSENTAAREVVVRNLLGLSNHKNLHKVKIDNQGKSAKYTFEDPDKKKYEAASITMNYSDGYDKKRAKVVFVNYKDKKQAVALAGHAATALYDFYAPIIESFFQDYESDHFSLTPLKINNND